MPDSHKPPVPFENDFHNIKSMVRNHHLEFLQVILSGMDQTSFFGSIHRSCRRLPLFPCPGADLHKYQCLAFPEQEVDFPSNGSIIPRQIFQSSSLQESSGQFFPVLAALKVVWQT